MICKNESITQGILMHPWISGANGGGGVRRSVGLPLDFENYDFGIFIDKSCFFCIFIEKNIPRRF
jgi:hypothetical protein